MQRQPEPELMEGPQQVQVYADADFGAGDAHTLSLLNGLLERTGALPPTPSLVDLGCGPGNITLRLAQAFPEARVIGVDGSAAMLAIARRRASELDLNVEFRCCDLRCLDDLGADLVTSNSLLHHLHQPDLLWRTTMAIAAPGCRVLHRDLRRPASIEALDQLQQRHLGEAPALLVRDFRASLAAAFEIQEVNDQLLEAGLGSWSVEPEDDRYLVVSGLVN
ncbi:MAG: class I SAM-dependent methyltransferase [Cyanobacteriota bacterium]|nr:class I SAM-dependent methyltransferase [Cyanobacteriota bacterium]